MMHAEIGSDVDGEECSRCDGVIIGTGFYHELEYPPADDTGVGYFAGYLCRGCADELAATVLADLEADDT